MLLLMWMKMDGGNNADVVGLFSVVSSDRTRKYGYELE